MESSKFNIDKDIWSEDAAKKFFKDLIVWLKKDEANIFMDEWATIEALPRKYGKGVEINHLTAIGLASEFPSCRVIYDMAKKIQEIKIYKHSSNGDLNSTMARFILINEHGKVSENMKIDAPPAGGISTDSVVYVDEDDDEE